MHQISDVCGGGGGFVLCERSRRHVVLLFSGVAAGYGPFMIMLSVRVFEACMELPLLWGNTGLWNGEEGWEEEHEGAARAKKRERERVRSSWETQELSH